MRSCSQTQHVLEMRDGESSWYRPIEDYYRPAVLLAYQGRIVEAIETAETARIQQRGDMLGIAFRVVTTTKTVTITSGAWDEAEFYQFPL